MSTVTLSLAEPAARWLDEQVATGRYANADAYLAELVECDRVEAEKHAALKAAIDEGLASGISDRSFEDILEEARAEVARA